MHRITRHLFRLKLCLTGCPIEKHSHVLLLLGYRVFFFGLVCITVNVLPWRPLGPDRVRQPALQTLQQLLRLKFGRGRRVGPDPTRDLPEVTGKLVNLCVKFFLCATRKESSTVVNDNV